MGENGRVQDIHQAMYTAPHADQQGFGVDNRQGVKAKEPIPFLYSVLVRGCNPGHSITSLERPFLEYIIMIFFCLESSTYFKDMYGYCNKKSHPKGWLDFCMWAGTWLKTYTDSASPVVTVSYFTASASLQR